MSKNNAVLIHKERLSGESVSYTVLLCNNMDNIPTKDEIDQYPESIIFYNKEDAIKEAKRLDKEYNTEYGIISNI